jgi:hypothetical protein
MRGCIIAWNLLPHKFDQKSMMSVENFQRNTFSFGPGLFCFVYRELASGAEGAQQKWGALAHFGAAGAIWRLILLAKSLHTAKMAGEEDDDNSW